MRRRMIGGRAEQTAGSRRERRGEQMGLPKRPWRTPRPLTEQGRMTERKAARRRRREEEDERERRADQRQERRADAAANG